MGTHRSLTHITSVGQLGDQILTKCTPMDHTHLTDNVGVVRGGAFGENWSPSWPALVNMRQVPVNGHVNAYAIIGTNHC